MSASVKIIYFLYFTVGIWPSLDFVMHTSIVYYYLL